MNKVISFILAVFCKSTSREWVDWSCVPEKYSAVAVDFNGIGHMYGRRDGKPMQRDDLDNTGCKWINVPGVWYPANHDELIIERYTGPIPLDMVWSASLELRSKRHCTETNTLYDWGSVPTQYTAIARVYSGGTYMYRRHDGKPIRREDLILTEYVWQIGAEEGVVAYQKCDCMPRRTVDWKDSFEVRPEE